MRGTFLIVCVDEDQKQKGASQLRLLICPMYSNPPKHGSSIVNTVLGDEALTAQYYEECKSMADRILEMRTKLVETLKEVGSTHDWSQVTRQIRMFAYTSMPEEITYIYIRLIIMIKTSTLLLTQTFDNNG